MGAFLGTFLSTLLGSAANPSSLSTTDDIAIAIATVSKGIYQLGLWVTEIIHRDNVAWRGVHDDVIAAGQGEADLADATHFALRRMLTTIIPNSLSWLQGWTVKWAINHFQPQINWLRRWVTFLLGWRNQIDIWRNRFVDPSIVTLNAWHRWFITWPQSILFMWKDWLAHPMHFAAWAVAPIQKQSVAYFQTPAGRQDMTQLVAEIIDATPERFRHVERATLAVLQSPWP